MAAQTAGLVERSQITMIVTERLNRYARAVDRCDWDGVRDCYCPDAFDNHGRYQGDIDGLIADMQRRHPDLDAVMHLITNVIVDVVSADAVLAESYCLAFARHREPESSGRQLLLTTRNRFLDKLVPCADGEWRIKSRVVVMDEVTRTEVTDTRPPEAAWSQRDRTDLLWEYLEAGAEWDARRVAEEARVAGKPS